MATSINPLRTAGLLAADGAALVLLRPDWAALARDLRQPHGWVAQVGADHAASTVAAAALWLCAALLALGFLLTALTVAPGRLGTLARRLAARVVPSVVLRIAGTTLGISIGLGVLSPALASAASTASTASTAGAVTIPPSPTSSSSVAGTAPSWPSWPSSADPSSPTSTSAPSWPVTPVIPVQPTVPAPVTTAPGSTPDATHLVRPGESLWTIAATALAAANPAHPVSDQQIATQVSAWYSANREVIGPDPALLHPGQQLLAPARTS